MKVRNKLSLKFDSSYMCELCELSVLRNLKAITILFLVQFYLPYFFLTYILQKKKNVYARYNILKNLFEIIKIWCRNV